MTTITMLALTLLSPPQFVVENRMSPAPTAFTVVNAMPTVKAAPAVAVKKTFQSGSYNSSHACPNCGRQQWVVQSGRANSPGHTHQCPSCRTVWWH